MGSTLMAIILTKKPIKLGHNAVSKAVAALASDVDVDVEMGPQSADSAVLRIDGCAISVKLIAAPIPMVDFDKILNAPTAKDLKNAVTKHTAQLIVTCRDAGDKMGDVVLRATVVHRLAKHLGDQGKPIAGYWVSSERLEDWDAISQTSHAALQAVDGSDGALFPAKFWVSVKLQQQGTDYGAETSGLQPFTGYELDLRPVSWPQERVAAQLLSIVQYLFQNGPVLADGERIESDGGIGFEMQHDAPRGRMKIVQIDANFADGDLAE